MSVAIPLMRPFHLEDRFITQGRSLRSSDENVFDTLGIQQA